MTTTPKNLSVLQGDSNFDSVLEEAAIQYSHGDTATALKTVSNAMTKVIGREKGLSDKRLWYILIDMMDDDPSKTELYNKTIDGFVLNFGVTTPPKRFDYTTANPNKFNWGASLSVQNSIALISEDKKRDFIRSLGKSKVCTLDLSRAKIEEEDEFLGRSLSSLWDIIKAISDNKSSVVLMGEARILEEIETALYSEIDFRERKKNGKPASRNNEQVFYKRIADSENAWHIIMEIHQWRGREPEFEKWFDSYIDYWNEAPMGYEPSHVLAITQKGGATTDSFLDGNILPEIISVKEMEEIIVDLEKQYRNHKKIKINFSRTKRVVYDASVRLTSWLKDLKIEKTKCIIVEPSTPVLIILNLTGMLTLCEVKQRRM